jgi:hypothetical protein
MREDKGRGKSKKRKKKGGKSKKKEKKILPVQCSLSSPFILPI